MNPPTRPSRPRRTNVRARTLPLFLAALVIAINAFAADSERPNILLILGDDQAWTDYSFMGHDSIRTPHLDQLAREGVLFPRGYVTTGLCRPSLMSIVTGHYASTHGVTGNDPSPRHAEPGSDLYNERRARLIANIDAFDTLPELLAERGYLSHQSGKWWEGNFRRGGFTHGMTRGFPEPGGRHGDDGLKIGREGLKECTDFIDLALEQEKPFFMWYAPFMPHTPHTPPERLLAKYQTDGRSDAVARYFAMCEWFDETVGELIAHLDARNLRENTLIIYVSDNGWIQSETPNRYAPRSKQTAYEGGVRQPMIFSWPGRLDPQTRSELVTNLDILPTILAAAGARSPERPVPGLNLLPHLRHESTIPRDAIFGESFAHDIADLDDPEASLLYRWCINGKWKLLLTYDGEVNRYQSTHPREEKRPQLFNLFEDPHETTNLAAGHPDVVAELAQRIHEWYPVENRRVQTRFTADADSD